MRTLPPRLLHLGALGGLASCLLALAACSDSIHLDPQPTPPGSGGFGAGGEGGGAPVSCVSNSDCPAPMAVCDEVQRVCVECLEVKDCIFRPGTVCSQGECRCPVEGESFCEPLGNQAARCVDLSASPADCGVCGHACFGACNAGACADPWEPTSLVNAPSPRWHHTAVWTGSQMIIWGGDSDGYTNTGGIYDLAANAWTSTSTANAPSPRAHATAIWTGSRMIIWGGHNGGPLGDGGIFDPVTNTWTALPAGSGAPTARWVHTAVWTGSKMIIWGGWDNASILGDGAIFTPAMDGSGGTWSPVELGGSPPAARREHTAVWASAGAGGSPRMLVFGGIGAAGVPLGDGSAYDVGQAWSMLAPGNAPWLRHRHTAVWTGADMLIWGGFDSASLLGNGKEYNLISNAWVDMSDPSPSPRQEHTAVWIGSPVSRMVMWGGQDNAGYLGTGGLYDPVTNIWTKAMPTAPLPRAKHTAVVADTRMIIWGGDVFGARTNTGGVFDAEGQ